jgi:hypothetical protein
LVSQQEREWINGPHQAQYDVCRFKLCNNVSLPFLAALM